MLSVTCSKHETAGISLLTSSLRASCERASVEWLLALLMLVCLFLQSVAPLSGPPWYACLRCSCLSVCLSLLRSVVLCNRAAITYFGMTLS